MDRSQFEFRTRLTRTGRHLRRSGGGMGMAKTRHMERNQRLAEIVARMDAQNGTAGAPLPSGEMVMERLARPAEAVVAICIGALALVFARFLRFQLLGQEVAATAVLAPSLDFAVDVVLAICLGFMLRQVLSLAPLRLMGSQSAGILLAAMTLHNLVHSSPGAFERLFSQEWVAFVTATTAPGTLSFSGRTLSL